MATVNKQTIIASSRKISYNDWLTNNISVLSEDKQDALLRAREHSEKLKHRGWWSIALIGIAVAINAVSLFVVIAIGYGWMTYPGDLAVPAIIVANFAETWALTKIAMKFYFNDDESINKK